MSETTILVVDDDQDIQVTTKVALSRAGYNVITASNGFEAVGAVRLRKPDLVLLDVMMPEENGYRVARTIREDEEKGVYEKPNLIVLVTARDLSATPDREELFQDFAKPDRVIYKPFDLDDLVAQVAELLAGK